MTKKEITKAKILLAATELVEKKGYMATSTKEIANRAGMAEGTIFKYFKSKENLLICIIEVLLQQLKEGPFNKSIPSIVTASNKTSIEKLELLYENRRDFFMENKSVIQIILQEMSVNKLVAKLFGTEIMPIIIKVLTTVIEEGKKKGELRDLPTHLIAIGFINVLLAPYMAPSIIAKDAGLLDSTDEQNILITIFIKGITEV